MAKDWIIDVLCDLRDFATGNDMPRLAEQMEEALVVASVEMAQQIARADAGMDGEPTGGLLRAVG